MELSHVKSDRQRLAFLSSIPCTEWHIVVDWEQQATDPEYKKAFHSAARRMYHMEEHLNGML